MSDILLGLSLVVLWANVTVMALMVLRLSQKRVQGPPKVTLWGEDHGLPVGAVFPIADFRAYDGDTELLLQPGTQGTLIIISSPTCPSCLELYPMLQPFHRDHSDLRLILAVHDKVAIMGRLIEEHGLVFPVVKIDDRGLEIIRNRLVPFAYLLDSHGIVRSKAVIDDRQDLEILLYASQDHQTPA